MSENQLKIILVEDDKALAESIIVYLKQDGFICDHANAFMSAEDKLLFRNYDLALIDITLPGGTGLDLVKTAKKQQPEMGIIIISAKNSLDDKLRGLDLGADDYLTKPFHLAELNARIKAIIRRKKFKRQETILFNEIVVDPVERTVSVHQKKLDLTKKEFDLLLFFISNKNRVLTKDAIVNHLWGNDADNSASFDFIYTHIKNLRKKLTEKGSGDYLQSIYGMGYKFSDK